MAAYNIHKDGKMVKKIMLGGVGVGEGEGGLVGLLAEFLLYVLHTLSQRIHLNLFLLYISLMIS